MTERVVNGCGNQTARPIDNDGNKRSASSGHLSSIPHQCWASNVLDSGFARHTLPRPPPLVLGCSSQRGNLTSWGGHRSIQQPIPLNRTSSAGGRTSVSAPLGVPPQTPVPMGSQTTWAGHPAFVRTVSTAPLSTALLSRPAAAPSSGLRAPSPPWGRRPLGMPARARGTSGATGVVRTEVHYPGNDTDRVARGATGGKPVVRFQMRSGSTSRPDFSPHPQYARLRPR
jgi:hypothetical protein